MRACVAQFLAEMAATPNPCLPMVMEQDIRCHECGERFLTRRGQHSGEWFAWHPANRCAGAALHTMRADSEEEIVRLCREAALR